MGDSLGVLLCGNVGTWILGQGLGREVVSHWHLPTLSGGSDPWEAPVSLLASHGEFFKTQVPWPHHRPRRCRSVSASSASRAGSQVHRKAGGRKSRGQREPLDTVVRALILVLAACWLQAAQVSISHFTDYKTYSHSGYSLILPSTFRQVNSYPFYT